MSESRPMSGDGGRWVVLDVGETIIDETRIWTAWADELGISRMTFMSVFGAIVERGLGYQHIPDYFDIEDWARHRDAVEAKVGGLQPEDLYPDVLPAMARIREGGYHVAVIGNQPTMRGPQLRALGVDPEVMAMSEEMGFMKPDPRFFAGALARLGNPEPATVAYVGDRIDNDVVPASVAGLRAIWIRRGPWGVIPKEVPAEATLVVGSLIELVERVGEAWVPEA